MARYWSTVATGGSLAAISGRPSLGDEMPAAFQQDAEEEHRKAGHNASAAVPESDHRQH